MILNRLAILGDQLNNNILNYIIRTILDMVTPKDNRGSRKFMNIIEYSEISEFGGPIY